MTWVKIDDGIYDHEKIQEVGPSALGIYVAFMAYCAKHRTDGYLTTRVARQVSRIWCGDDGGHGGGHGGDLSWTWQRAEADIKRLLKVELLETWAGDDTHPAGYRVHDYLIYNPSRAQLEAADGARAGSGSSHAAPQAPARARASAPDPRPMPGPERPNPAPRVLESSTDVDDQSPGAREAPRRIDSNHRRKSRRTKNGDGDIHELIIATLLRVTGKRVDRDWAEKVRALLLDDRTGVSDQHKYVENAILAEGNPTERFLPISSPAYEYILPGKVREWIAAKESEANGQPTAAHAGVEPGAGS